jgi:hypothetical protein
VGQQNAVNRSGGGLLLMCFLFLYEDLAVSALMKVGIQRKKIQMQNGLHR